MTKRSVMVALKRVYDEPAPDDGTRVLVPWPRGISKEHAHIDLWLKEIAPSRELRIWFGHDPEKFATCEIALQVDTIRRTGRSAQSF